MIKLILLTLCLACLAGCKKVNVECEASNVSQFSEIIYLKSGFYKIGVYNRQYKPTKIDDMVLEYYITPSNPLAIEKYHDKQLEEWIKK